MNLFKKYISDRKGASAVVFALSLPVVLGGIAMTVEIGHWRQSKARLQNAADMAAIAGARQMLFANAQESEEDSRDLDVYLAAFGDAYENGFDRSTGSIVINSPPESGAYAGEPGVEVILKQKKERAFTGLFSNKEVFVTARAVALSTSGESPSCVLSLSTTAGPAVSVSGAADLDVSDCGIRSNSNAANSIHTGGGGSITAGCAYTAGSVDPGINFTATNADCSGVSTNQAPMPDPYAGVTAPSAAELAALPCTSPTIVHKWQWHLTSGKYCSTVDWKDTITLEKGGTFIFDGADLMLKSGFAELIGEEVTIIFMNGGSFYNARSGYVNLTAKSTGPYAGIVMYADPLTSDPSDSVSFGGNSNQVINGALYFPVQHVDFRGGTDGLSECTQVIGNTVDFGGNSTLSNTNCDAYGVETIGGTPSGVVLNE